MKHLNPKQAAKRREKIASRAAEQGSREERRTTEEPVIRGIQTRFGSEREAQRNLFAVLAGSSTRFVSLEPKANAEAFQDGAILEGEV